MNDRLFVYGTLRKDAENGRYHLLERSAAFVGYARMRGRLLNLGAFPGFTPAGDGISGGDESWVRGELYALRNPSETLPRLDRYEGCGPGDPEPRLFERVGKKLVLPSGDDGEAWVYVYRGPSGGAPEIASGDYVEADL